MSLKFCMASQPQFKHTDIYYFITKFLCFISDTWWTHDGHMMVIDVTYGFIVALFSHVYIIIVIKRMAYPIRMDLLGSINCFAHTCARSEAIAFRQRKGPIRQICK